MFPLTSSDSISHAIFYPQSAILGQFSVLPATSLREQEAYARRSLAFLDAPVFGSKNESANAKLFSGG